MEIDVESHKIEHRNEEMGSVVNSTIFKIPSVSFLVESPSP